MVDRLSSLDTSFLHLEDATTPMHVGSVMVFDPPKEGFDYDQFVQVISDRIAGRRRYRQRVRHVPGRIANPVWVDDPHFDLSYHVRRSALPVPGDQGQLEEFVARILSRPLDRDRPLWEAYFVEGVEDGRFAVVTKAHQSMVDGIEAVDIAALILDPEAVAGEDPGEYAPSDLRLVADAVMSSVLSPRTALGTLRTGLRDVTDTGRRVAETAGQVVATLAKVGASPAPDSPLNQPVGSARRFVVLKTDLEDYRSIRTRLTRGRYVEDVTINDVVLATISGGLRTWMQTRGLPVTSTTTVRVMVPVSIKGDDGDAADPQDRVQRGGEVAARRQHHRPPARRSGAVVVGPGARRRRGADLAHHRRHRGRVGHQPQVRGTVGGAGHRRGAPGAGGQRHPAEGGAAGVRGAPDRQRCGEVRIVGC